MFSRSKARPRLRRARQLPNHTQSLHRRIHHLLQAHRVSRSYNVALGKLVYKLSLSYKFSTSNRKARRGSDAILEMQRINLNTVKTFDIKIVAYKEEKIELEALDYIAPSRPPARR